MRLAGVAALAMAVAVMGCEGPAGDVSGAEDPGDAVATTTEATGGHTDDAHAGDPCAWPDRVDLAGRTVEGDHFVGTDLACADLSDATLLQVRFDGASAALADFSGSVLEGGDIAATDLVGADFSGATLDGVRIEGSSLANAVFDGAALSDVTFVDTLCPDGTGSDAAGGTCHGHGLSVRDG